MKSRNPEDDFLPTTPQDFIFGNHSDQLKWAPSEFNNRQNDVIYEIYHLDGYLSSKIFSNLSITKINVTNQDRNQDQKILDAV
jgi:hypothetical protein